MKTPHVCPICHGTTNVPGGFYNCCPGGTAASSSMFDKCRACTNGVVWEEERITVQQVISTGSGYTVSKEIFCYPDERSSILGGTTELLKKILKAIKGLGKKV